MIGGNDIVDHILIEGWLPTLTEWESPPPPTLSQSVLA